MKKRLTLFWMTVVLSSAAFSAAPVEEAHDYIAGSDANAQDVVAQSTEETTSEGFKLAELPKESWQKPDDVKEEKPVHLAMNDELTPAADSTSMNMSAEQRLLYLSQQVDNLTKMNLASQLNDLQEQVAQLRGQLQDQDRIIKTLQAQQDNFYENMNGKMKQLQDQITTPGGSSNALNGGTPTPDNKLSSSPVTPSIASVSLPPSLVTKRIKLADTDAYQAAFNSLMDKQYAKAQEGFNRYLHDYPDGQYSGNVHYWLGEIALLENRYPQAEASFSEVVSRYQESGKLQDARYKLAITHLKMGETEKAKTELLAIEQQNAGNTVARLAKLQLQELS